MSARLRQVARDNDRILAEGGYEAAGRWVPVGEAAARAADGTRMYGPGPVAGAGRAAADAPRARPAEVTAETSLAAARRLVADGADGADRVGVLNFSSARNPGGGYVNGARAQEEELCRASALYPALLRAPEFYAAHRADPSPFYTHRVIHSPAVPVFRDDAGALLAEPYAVDFLTSPAPNAGVIAQRTPEETDRIPAALTGRAERVLEVAAVAGVTALVLGAWGCGVFRNDPAQVAAAFRTHLEPGGRFAGRFGRLVFAVWDRQPRSANREAFEAAFGTG
ncbi:TIGR02452 family protein [Streptomyces sp. WMMC500]|uniref:TIGR02452 family protein n=1 Tax=Streptomyces sp. WMMC500 TaxID=3015154 RepID=UPI00248BDB31|nr:TIGR02452 family protein [Streptomyces sp. WMMC500]WBB60901.1 TIGR02452 family protein [Streptomyces sp. WMMC500]